MELRKGTLADSIGKLVNNKDNADTTIVFKNSDVKYFAHKLILSSRSDVFRTMFYGAVEKVTTNSSEFEIADMEPETFLELLRFMYTDQINLNDKNFSYIVYASHKYNIEFLDSVCADFLRERLDINNVCSFLNQCVLYNNAATEECLMVIDWTISDLIKLKKLDDLSDEALILLAERDTLIVKELDLFKFVIKRADNLSDTNDTISKREKINSIFKKIRFPTMSADDFSECYKLKPDLFTSEQISSIFKCCSTAIQDNNLLYSATKRSLHPNFNNSNVNVIEFSGYKISKQKAHTLKFRVNRPISLCSIDFTACDGEVDMKICKLDEMEKSEIILQEKIDWFHRIVTTDIILLPNIQYVLQTRSGHYNKMIYDKVCETSKFKDLFEFQCFDTVVKNISFKLPSRKQKLEIE